MNDQDTLLAPLGDHLIHPWGHFPDPPRCSLAPMLVPHVADHDGGLVGLPFERMMENLELPLLVILGDFLIPRMEGKGVGRCRDGQTIKDERSSESVHEEARA